MSLDEDVQTGREKWRLSQGTGGIGRAAALGLAEAGAHVAVLGKTQDPEVTCKESLHWVESPWGFRGILPRADFWTEWCMKRLRDGITSTF